MGESAGARCCIVLGPVFCVYTNDEWQGPTAGDAGLAVCKWVRAADCRITVLLGYTHPRRRDSDGLDWCDGGGRSSAVHTGFFICASIITRAASLFGDHYAGCIGLLALQ